MHANLLAQLGVHIKNNIQVLWGRKDIFPCL